MVLLDHAGYETITLETFVRFVQGKHVSLPPRPLLLTFDGGRRASWTGTDAILRELGFNAVVFVDVGRVEQADPDYLTYEELSRLQTSDRWDVQLQSGSGNRQIQYGPSPDDVGPFYAYRGSEEVLGGWRERVFSDITYGEEQLAGHVRGYRPLAFAPPYGNYGQAGTNDRHIPRELLGRLLLSFEVVFTQDRSGFASPGSNNPLGRIEITRDVTEAELHALLEPARRAPRGRARRAERGPSSASIAVIRPSTTVKASTATGTPSSVATKPAAPSTIAGCATRPVAGVPRAARHGAGALDDPQRAAAVVGAQDDVGVQHREQPLEVAAAGGGQERVDDLPVGGGRVAVRALDAAPRPRGELPRRRRRSVDDQRDVLERHREQVVEHERQALGGLQRLEHDEQRGADRVGGQRLRLRVRRGVVRPRDRSGRAAGRASSASSRRRLRASSIVRHTRETTVVSHPPMFSTRAGVGAVDRGSTPLGARRRPRRGSRGSAWRRRADAGGVLRTRPSRHILAIRSVKA